MNWKAEIEELHDFFERWYDGDEDDFSRCEAALADGFTIVGPRGDELDRAAIMDLVRNAKGRGGMKLSTEDHRLVWEDGDVLVTRYIEVHDLGDEQTRRLSTAVFQRDDDAPNGLVWVRVHETWTE